ncbi:MAG: DUF6940 family protein, partial [Gammaproteobacteria bacterium]
MWTYTSIAVDGCDARLITIESDGEALSYRDAVTGWTNNEAFRAFFIDLLLKLPFETFRWETPSVTAASADRPLECVVINSPALDIPADRETFGELFAQMEPGGVGQFSNLGGDAIMVVPGPVDATSSYSHFGAFLRSAPAAQLQAFWTAVGQAVLGRLGEKPLWLNTAG